METINVRVIKWMSYKKLNNITLAEKLLCTHQLVSAWKRNLTKVSLEMVIKIITEFPDLNPRWLLIGEGSMVVGEILEDSGSQLYGKDALVMLVEKTKECTLLEVKVHELEEQLSQYTGGKAVKGGHTYKSRAG